MTKRQIKLADGRYMIFYTFVPVAPRVDSNSSSPTGSEEKKSEKQDKEN